MRLLMAWIAVLGAWALDHNDRIIGWSLLLTAVIVMVCELTNDFKGRRG